MVDGYLSTKFGIDSLDGFWENAFYGRWTDGRTTDARATALALLTQSSRAKNQWNMSHGLNNKLYTHQQWHISTNNRSSSLATCLSYPVHGTITMRKVKARQNHLTRSNRTVMTEHIHFSTKVKVLWHMWVKVINCILPFISQRWQKTRDATRNPSEWHKPKGKNTTCWWLPPVWQQGKELTGTWQVPS